MEYSRYTYSVLPAPKAPLCSLQKLPLPELQAKDAASRGLRVLCVAYREMDRVTFEEWKARFDAIEDADERDKQDLDRWEPRTV